MQNKNIDQHFAGTFNIDGEEIAGELIYNKEKGVTMLNLIKQLTDVPIGRSYPNLGVITGVLNSGTTVTLFTIVVSKTIRKDFRHSNLFLLLIIQYGQKEMQQMLSTIN